MQLVLRLTAGECQWPIVAFLHKTPLILLPMLFIQSVFTLQSVPEFVVMGPFKA